MNVKDADWFCVEAKILPGVFQYRKKITSLQHYGP